MTLNDILDKITTYKANTMEQYTQSSVLIPLVRLDGSYHLLYEVRADHLSSQPGDICFPGGRVEGSEDSKETAIRETMEELNLSRSAITIMGELDRIVTPYRYVIHVFVGVLDINSLAEIDFSRDEVKSIFAVPVEYLLEQDMEKYKFKTDLVVPNDFPLHRINNGEDYQWNSSEYPVYMFSYEEHTVWGLTARMTKNILDVLKKK